MTRYFTLALVLAAASVSGPAVAQEQQAGNTASTNADETFQALMDACDDIDTIMLRNRIRLQLAYATDEAGAEAQRMIDEGFAACGSGDLETAQGTLTAALDLVSASASEQLAATEAAHAAEATEAAAEGDTEEESSGRGFFGRLLGN